MESKARHERFVDSDLDWLGEPVEQKDWDEGKHPREPSGGPGGGQFTSGGGGGEGDEGGGKAEGDKPKESGKGGGKEPKVKEIADFAKADIGMYYNPHDKKQEQEFIDQWNSKIDRTPEEFKAEYFGKGAVGGSMTVEYDPSENALTVDSNLADYGGKIKSTFYFDEKRVHMDYYALPPSAQGHGIMKKVMGEQMKIWKDAGMKTVDLYANINVGGHAWARYGFEPLPNVWGGLASDIEYKIERLGSGGGSGVGAAESWDDLSVPYQERIHNSWLNDTYAEFLESEKQSWREGGDALEQAKNQLVDDFNNTSPDDIRYEAGLSWASNAIAGYRSERKDSGKSDIPFTDKEIQQAIGLNFTSKYKDGDGDVDVTFSDDKLTNPTGVSADPTLPGMPTVEPHEHLTDDMRGGITDAIKAAFNTKADRLSEDIPPPDYLSDNVVEFQNEYWSGMDDSEKFKWAEHNRSDLVGGVYDTPKGSGKMSKEDEATLLKAVHSDDPKALWIIADSKWGKDLLLDRLWDGKMDLNDKLAMERFNAYVGSAKPAP